MFSCEEQEHRKRSQIKALFAMDGPPDPGIIEQLDLVVEQPHSGVYRWQAILSTKDPSDSLLYTLRIGSDLTSL